MSRRSVRIYGGPDPMNDDFIAKVTEDGKLHVTDGGTPLEVTITGQPIDVTLDEPIDVNATIVGQPINVNIANEPIDVTLDEPIQVENPPDESLSVKFGDSPSIDAFDRLRVSNPTGIFDSTQLYDKQPLLWNEELTGLGSATFLPNQASVQMTVTDPADKVIRQSRQYSRYQPGKSQLVFATFKFGEFVEGVRKRVGYFDTNDGIFLELWENELWIVLRSCTTGTPVDTRISQGNFNIDTLSNFDRSKAQILVIDFEWLGVGRVRVGCVEDGLIRYAHEFLNANNVTEVYMGTAQLPVRYEIEAVEQPAEEDSLLHICSSVISEGGQEEGQGFPFSVAGQSLISLVSATRVPLMSIRPKTTFNSLPNRVEILIREIETALDGNNGFVAFQLIFDGTLTGGVWNSVNADSVMEFNDTATSVAGGQVVRSFYGTTTTQNQSAEEKSLLGKLPISLDINGANPTVITLVGILFQGTGSAAGALNWQEFR